MKNKPLLVLTILLIISQPAFAQQFRFAFLSDTHIGVKNADVDLKHTVEDINADTALQFVIISGDITENSFDDEMWTAKSILSS